MQWVVSGYARLRDHDADRQRLTDTYGRRRMFLSGSSSALLDPRVAGVGRAQPDRICRRSAAGFSPTSMAIITDVVPPGRAAALGWGARDDVCTGTRSVVERRRVGRPMTGASSFWSASRSRSPACHGLHLRAGEQTADTRPPFDIPGCLLLSTARGAADPAHPVDRLGWDDVPIESRSASLWCVAAFIARVDDPHPISTSRCSRADFRRRGGPARARDGLLLRHLLAAVIPQTVLGWRRQLSGWVLVLIGVAAFLMPVTGWLAGPRRPTWLVFGGMAIATYGTFLFTQLDLSWDAESHHARRRRAARVSPHLHAVDTAALRRPASGRTGLGHPQHNLASLRQLGSRSGKRT